MNKEVIKKTLNDNFFFFNGESYLNSQYEKDTTVFHIVNQRLLSLRANGLDLQYKIHVQKDQAYIELAFTVYPYWKTLGEKLDFKSGIEKHYNRDVAERILQVRDFIKKAFVNKYKKELAAYERNKTNFKNFIWLVKHRLENVDETNFMAEIYTFINDTYPLLQRELKNLEL